MSRAYSGYVMERAMVAYTKPQQWKKGDVTCLVESSSIPTKKISSSHSAEQNLRGIIVSRKAKPVGRSGSYC